MGNTSCTLGVQTEKRVYFSGETVNGRVYLSVNDANGIVAQTVNLHCSGIERGVVHYTEERSDTNDRTRQIERYEENEVEILNFDIPINTPVGSLFQQGQYEFPFMFVLPQNLPSSMFCKTWESRCEVRYEMRAYLAKHNTSSSYVNPFNSNTISSKPLPFNVFGGSNNSSMYHTNQPIYFPGETHQVRNCCCCYRGQMTLRASLENGTFVPNQTQSLTFELINSSKAKVENVTVELIERVSWKPRFREESQTFTLFKNVIDASSHRDWMSTEQRIEQTISEVVSLSPTSRMGPGQMVNVSTPHNARDSYCGRMIQVQHFVRVMVVTKGFCVSNPETTADVIVTRPLQAFYDNSGAGNNNDGEQMQSPPPPVPSAPFMDEGEQPIVEATVLPPDWSPLTSDTVTIPVADVVTVSNQNYGDGQYQGPVVQSPIIQK